MWAVKYCFRCFKFFQQDKEWELHCESHLEKLSMDCGAVTWHECWTNRFCIQDGFCPFCTCGSGSAKERYRVFDQPRLLRKHVARHIESQRKWPMVCPHPCCSWTLADQNDICCHLDEYHGIDGLQKLASTEAMKVSITPKKREDPEERFDKSAKRKRSCSASVEWSNEDLDTGGIVNLESVASPDEKKGKSLSLCEELPCSTQNVTFTESQSRKINNSGGTDCPEEEFFILSDSSTESSDSSDDDDFAMAYNTFVEDKGYDAPESTKRRATESCSPEYGPPISYQTNEAMTPLSFEDLHTTECIDQGLFAHGESFSSLDDREFLWQEFLET